MVTPSPSFRPACWLFCVALGISTFGLTTPALNSAHGNEPAGDNAHRERWVLDTRDTHVSLHVNTENQLCLDELRGPDGWNWTATPSVLPLLDRVTVAGTQITPQWRLDHAERQQSDNATTATLTFRCVEPALQLKSVWTAHPGPGPVRHVMFIQNLSPQLVTIGKQESMEVQLAGPDMAIRARYIRDDGAVPDEVGVYCDPLTADYHRELPITEGEDFIPLAIVDANDQQGVYVGWEWSVGRLTINGLSTPRSARVIAGNGDLFRTDLDPGETFDVPPAFLGTYRGDLDDAANSLHKYLFAHAVPKILRQDPQYPRVEWNAFAATGLGQGSWIPTETKYYPLIDDIAPLGFDDVVIDVGWWEGDTTTQPRPPIGNAKLWPRGMRAASDYAHEHGMRFGLYWNHNTSMTTAEGRQLRQEDVQHLFHDFNVDYYRTDGTDGNVLQIGELGPESRAHYAEDLGYWQTKGFYEVTDWLQANVPGFLYENCTGGGRLKDYGVMKRAIRIQDQDRYYPIDARRAFWDASYAMHPMQLSTLSGSWSEWQASGSVYEFRSASLGAPYWHPDAPNGGNGGPKWSESQRLLIKQAVETYKSKIRPLVRHGNLYHVFPRPDDKNWDGIEYFDPDNQRGAIYVFRPESPESQHTIKLRGLTSEATYWVWCEDGAFAARQIGGEKLMTTGLTITLPKPFSSDLVFLQNSALGKPTDFATCGEFTAELAKATSELFSVSAEFTWSVSANAQRYRVTLSDSPDFAHIVASELSATTSIMLTQLPPNTKLYWKVEAIAPGSVVPSSDGPGEFTTPDILTRDVTFASDLPWIMATAGADNTVHRGTNLHGRPININGLLYPIALWTHAFNDSTPADIVFDISNQGFADFRATVGLEDLGSQGSVQFQVLVDGEVKAESPLMRPRATFDIVANVEQGHKVTLRVLNGGDGYFYDHAAWGSPRFIKKGGTDPLGK